MRKSVKPDRFDDTSVSAEAPDREAYHKGQPNLDAEMVADVEFPQTRVIREAWAGMPRKR